MEGREGGREGKEGGREGAISFAARPLGMKCISYQDTHLQNPAFITILGHSGNLPHFDKPLWLFVYIAMYSLYLSIYVGFGGC